MPQHVERFASVANNETSFCLEARPLEFEFRGVQGSLFNLPAPLKAQYDLPRVTKITAGPQEGRAPGLRPRIHQNSIASLVQQAVAASARGSPW